MTDPTLRYRGPDPHRRPPSLRPVDRWVIALTAVALAAGGLVIVAPAAPDSVAAALSWSSFVVVIACSVAATSIGLCLAIVRPAWFNVLPTAIAAAILAGICGLSLLGLMR